MIKYILLAAALAGGSTAFAEEQGTIGNIRQILSGSKRAIAYLNENQNVTLNSDVIVTFADGKQCALKVFQIKPGRVLLDTSGCPRAEDLIVGQVIERSLFEEDPQPSQQASATPEPSSVLQPQSAKAPPPESTPARYEDSLSRITDIGFRPERHQALVEPRASFSRFESKVSAEVSGQKSTIYDQTLIGNNAAISVAYGFTDYFAISASFEYLMKSSNELRYGPASVNSGTWVRTNSFGIKDPEFGISFRVPTSDVDGTRVDLALSHSPSLINAKFASRTSDGNGGRGGPRSGISLLTSKKLKIFEFGFLVGYSILGNRVVEIADGSDTARTTGGNSLALSGLMHLNLSSQILLRAGFGLESVAQTETDYQKSTAFTKISAYTFPTAEAGVLVDLGRIGLGVIYQYAFETDVNGSISGVEGSMRLSGWNLVVIGRTLF